MSKKTKDTDYLTMSAMLRAREANMLGRDRMDRMLAAGSYGEAAKLLAECGYEDLSDADAAGVDAALTRRRAAVFEELAGMAPQPEVVDIFRLKYDYHNLKTLVKAAGAQVSGDRLLSDCGRVPADKLKAAVEEDRLSDLPADMAAAYESARSLLARTGNPQLADFELDAAYFAELMRLAEATGSEFIKGYVRTMIDSANLRAAVRTVRMGKDRDFMLTALAPGGFADRENLAAAAESGDRMLAAGSYGEAAKLLAECGYEDLSDADAAGVDAALTRRRAAVFEELAGMAPQPEVVDIFRLKYDYHNLKTLVKAAGAQVSGDRLLSDCGRVPADKLKAAVEEDRLSDLPADMAAAYESARSLLARTGNPQLADFELDAAYFAELMRLAEATGSEFIKGYVRTMIDSANLRAAVRTVRMGKDRDFMLTALAPGGFADRENLAAAAESGDGLAAIFASTCLEHAAALGAEAMKGGPLTDFELACDNGVSAYLSQAKTKPFGIEPAAEYLALLEGEITAARMILTGRLAGIEPEVIRERLRDINA